MAAKSLKSLINEPTDFAMAKSANRKAQFKVVPIASTIFLTNLRFSLVASLVRCSSFHRNERYEKFAAMVKHAWTSLSC
jgi:hypothetical protein